MAPFNTYRFNVVPAGEGKASFVAGTDITLPSSTTAEGLLKSGNIDIHANGNGNRNVLVSNEGGGSMTFDVHGNITCNNNIDATNVLSGGSIESDSTVKITTSNNKWIALDGNPTGKRTATFPDKSGNVAIFATGTTFDYQVGFGAGTYLPFGQVHQFQTGSGGQSYLLGATSGNSQNYNLPPNGGVIAAGSIANAIPDLDAGTATASDCANAINSILAALRSFQVVKP